MRCCSIMHLGARTNPVFMEEFIGLYQNHLDRVEELVRRLLDHQYDSAQGYGRFRQILLAIKSKPDEAIP